MYVKIMAGFFEVKGVPSNLPKVLPIITSETACLLLHFLPKIGVIRAQRLIRHFKAPEKIFSAETKALLTVEGMGLKQVSVLQQWETYLPRVRAEKKFMEREGIRAILPIHEEYPMRLLHCPDAPVVLFCKVQVRSITPKWSVLRGPETPPIMAGPVHKL